MGGGQPQWYGGACSVGSRGIIGLAEQHCSVGGDVLCRRNEAQAPIWYSGLVEERPVVRASGLELYRRVVQRRYIHKKQNKRSVKRKT